MNSVSILTVEDNASNRLIIEALLSRHFNRIESCASGEEALALLQQGHHPYDLVFVDIILPNMSGLELLRILRQSDETRDLPIICVSALAYQSDRVAGMAAGADAYLSKPYEGEELYQTVQQVLLKRGRAISLV